MCVHMCTHEYVFKSCYMHVTSTSHLDLKIMLHSQKNMFSTTHFHDILVFHDMLFTTYSENNYLSPTTHLHDHRVFHDVPPRHTYYPRHAAEKACAPRHTSTTYSCSTTSFHCLHDITQKRTVAHDIHPRHACDPRHASTTNVCSTTCIHDTPRAHDIPP